jgi:hypothetical protein
MPDNDYPLADSGDRTPLHGGAMRDRPRGKGRFDLISPIFLQDLALLMEKGADKYAVRNWERGYSISLCADSAMRHLTQFLAGDDTEDHVIQAAWNLMVIHAIRRMVEQGKLPKELAEGYVPLHVVNPITGSISHDGETYSNNADIPGIEEDPTTLLVTEGTPSLDGRFIEPNAVLWDGNEVPIIAYQGGRQYNMGRATDIRRTPTGEIRAVILLKDEPADTPTYGAYLTGLTTHTNADNVIVIETATLFAVSMTLAPRYGAQSQCRLCKDAIGWNGSRWVDASGDADQAGFCRESNDPDPQHIPNIDADGV